MLNAQSGRESITAIFDEHRDVLERSRAMTDDIFRAADAVTSALAAGGKILLCGNGGSAADAQHIAGELVGRFLLERRALPAVALHTDTTILTAVANDYGYETIYERQVEALGKPGDVLVGLTTSGNSPNVVRAAIAAKAIGMTVIGMTGEGGGKLADISDVALRVPSKVTARIQEMHITIGHGLCQLAEAHLAAHPPQ